MLGAKLSGESTRPRTGDPSFSVKPFAHFLSPHPQGTPAAPLRLWDGLVLLGPSSEPPFWPREAAGLAHCPLQSSPVGLPGDTQGAGRSVCTLLSRDSKASEVEDLELFMPEEAAGRGRARSAPWPPALMTGLQALAALLMFVLVSLSFCTRPKRKTCVSTTRTSPSSFCYRRE